MDSKVYDFNVGSVHPSSVTTVKVSFVQWLKSYVIWIQIRVIQGSFYFPFLPVQKVKRNKANFK